MTRPRHYLAPLIGATLLLAGACGDDSSDATSEPQTLRLYDHGFDMPDQITGPLIDIDIINDGAVAHELALAHVTPGTTIEELLAVIFDDTDTPTDFILDDPGGINMLGAGESLRYQRILQPGTYVLFCPFASPAGGSHADHGMAQEFEVTDTDHDEVPETNATIALHDDAIDVPELHPGTAAYAITNDGSVPHEVFIAGLPTDDPAIDDPDAIGAEIGAWIEGGQVGPAPHDLRFPGGHQTIAPGETVVLTMSLLAGHTYQFGDFSGDQPIITNASTP